MIEYRKHGYKTLEEEAYQEEKKDRKNAQRITIAIALITITISTILSLLSNCSNQNTISNKIDHKVIVDTIKINDNVRMTDSLNSIK